MNWDVNNQRVLLLAAVTGLVTGILALVGHVATTVLHGVGGVVALALVAIVAYRIDSRAIRLLVAMMVVANITGVAWTFQGATEAIVISHVIIGVFASAGALLLATNPTSNRV